MTNLTKEFIAVAEAQGRKAEELFLELLALEGRNGDTLFTPVDMAAFIGVHDD